MISELYYKLYWGSIRVKLGLYSDNGEENQNYYNGGIEGLGFRGRDYRSVYWVYIGIMEKKMEYYCRV